MFENLLLMQNEGREFEDELIRNTLDRISSDVALLLLQRLSMKFRVRPRKTISLLRWLVPLLNRHAGVFSKNLACRKSLESINQAIDYHIKSILPAMKLQGRLSLLVNQIDKVRQLKEKEKEKERESGVISIQQGLKQARYQALFTHYDDKE